MEAQTPIQGNLPKLQEWLSSEQNRMQHQSLQANPSRMEFLLSQLAQQWHQDKLEMRQDLMFICQYLTNLTERQDQLWHQMHVHHDQILAETRHSFQTLSSFFMIPTNVQANTAHTFPVQENVLKQELTLPAMPFRTVPVIPDHRMENIGHQNNEDKQRGFTFGTVDMISSSDDITIVKTSPGEPSSTEQGRMMPEYKQNEQATPTYQHHNLADQFPDRHTYGHNLRQLNGQSDESLGVSNKPQAATEIDEQLPSRRGGGHHMNSNFINSETNSEISGKSLIRSDRKEPTAKIQSVDEQNVQARQAKEHKVQGGHIDEHNVHTRHTDKQQVPGRYIDEEKIHTRHHDKQQVQSRYVEEQKVYTRHTDKQQVQSRYTDKQNIQSRHTDKQQVQERHTDKQQVQERHTDEQSVHTKQIDGQKEKSKDEYESNYRSKPSQHDNLQTNTNDSKKQMTKTDENVSSKKYADVVVAGTPSAVLKFNSPSGESDTLKMPVPLVNSNVLDTQESFEGTGFYADIISNQFSNSTHSPVGSVKSVGSSNGKTYNKAMASKYYDSSKGFSSAYKGGKQNQRRFQDKSQ